MDENMTNTAQVIATSFQTKTAPENLTILSIILHCHQVVRSHMGKSALYKLISTHT
jgi:hypothetical protein